jgi:hypothetical protein
MVPLSALWLPIVLSAVIIFFASFVMHMVLTYHRSNYHQLPDEDKVSSTLRAANLQRGTYVFPFCTPKEMKSPAAQEKYKQGPVGLLTIMPPGPPAMPKFLGLWFAYTFLVSFFVAYLTAHTVAPGSSYLAVFRVVGTAAFLAYGLGALPSGIWKGQAGSVTGKEVIDGLIYALLTAGTFGWLWPRGVGM